MIFKLLKDKNEITTIESNSLEEAIATCELLEAKLDGFYIMYNDEILYRFENKQAFKTAREQFKALGSKVRENMVEVEGELSDKIFVTKLIFTDNVEAVETDEYVTYKHKGKTINPVLFEIQPLRDIKILRYHRLEDSNKLFDVNEGYEETGVVEHVNAGEKAILNYKEFAFLITSKECAGSMSTITHKPVRLNIAFHGGEPVITVRSKECIATDVIYLDANNKKLGLTNAAKAELPDIEQIVTKIALKQEAKSVADLAAGLRELIQKGVYESEYEEAYSDSL